MDVINFAATAMFEAFDEAGLDRNLMLEGTPLKLTHFNQKNRRFSWFDFVRMYENSIKYLGYENAIHRIAYHGTYNKDLTALRKIGLGFITAKSAYRFLIHFVLKLFYKDSLLCEYRNVGKKEIEIKLSIPNGYEKCPGLFDTYTIIFQALPTVLGLPKASVRMFNEGKSATYRVKFDDINYFSYFFRAIFKTYTAYKNSVDLLREIEEKGQSLEKTVQEKSLLLKIISHDIANHVQLINMYLEKAEEMSIAHPEVHRKILGAVRSKNKLNEILANVRLLEKGENEVVEKTIFSVSEVLQNIEEDFSLRCLSKNIELKIKNDLKESLYAYGNQISLEVNILGNLLTNAIKFSYPNSKIVLEVKADQTYIFLSIIDFGIGISDLEFRDIFALKINKSDIGTMGEQGTGFGLGIVKTFINAIGAEIKVERTNPQGTTFVLKINRAYSPLDNKQMTEKIGKNKNENFLSQV